jgi:hypothetical protein
MRGMKSRAMLASIAVAGTLAGGITACHDPHQDGTGPAKRPRPTDNHEMVTRPAPQTGP